MTINIYERASRVKAHVEGVSKLVRNVPDIEVDASSGRHSILTARQYLGPRCGPDASW